MTVRTIFGRSYSRISNIPIVLSIILTSLSAMSIAHVYPRHVSLSNHLVSTGLHSPFQMQPVITD